MNKQKKVSLKVCKRNLSLIWVLGIIILFLVLAIQSSFEHYQGLEIEAMKWMSQNLLPNSILIIGVLASDASAATPARYIDRHFYIITITLCILYMLLLFIPIMLQPFVEQNPKAFIDLMNKSNFWLSPFQGLLSASVASIFAVKKSQD